MSEPTGSQSLRKPRLGRGLGSLLSSPSDTTSAFQTNSAPAAGLADSTSESKIASSPADEGRRVWSIPVEKISPNPQQPRRNFDEDALTELTSSIKEQGILQPLLVRKLDEGKFELIAGERRWRAAQRAGLREVPVLLRQVDAKQSLELAIIENLQRADLDPIEEAEAFERLIREFHLTQQQVADRLGKERSSIANSLRLLSLAPEVRLMVASSQLSVGHAKVILGHPEREVQISLAKQASQAKWSVRQLEQHLESVRHQEEAEVESTPADSSASKAERAVRALEAELQKLIGTRTRIKYRGGSGSISIQFQSSEQLNQIVLKLKRGFFSDQRN